MLGCDSRMYIDTLIIEGYGIFSEKTEIKFNDGLNVLIGPNNSGKSTVLNALRILLDKDYPKRLEIADFSRTSDIATYRNTPPEVAIKLILKEKSVNKEEYSDKIVTVSEWLTKIGSPFEAQLTYRFFLPETELQDYKKDFKDINAPKVFWGKLEDRYLKKYRHEFLVGHSELGNKVDYEDLRRFSLHYFDAIRDVERDMFKGSSTLLKEVIQFFIDFELKSNSEVDDKTISRVEKNKEKFNESSKQLIEILEKRMKSGKKEIFNYTKKMGAHKGENEEINLEGSLSETELYSVLRLMVKSGTGISLPVTHNGSGFNNLIYISLLLAKMQKNRDVNYVGENISVFSLLAIEEPEAHLHPNMQYRFLKYLAEEQKDKVDQIFITTHSPNITASIDLNSLIALQKLEGGKMHIAYPGKVFQEENEDDNKSKKYIQRFLDVTKSDILFADRIIFVEGITEQMILTRMANIMGKSLEDNYVSVINLGGRYYTHFLKLFDEENDYAIRKKVAFITDRDLMRKSLEDSEINSEKCPAVSFNKECDKYEYIESSNPMWEKYKDLFDSDRADAWIRGFMQDEKSTTFEDALIYANPTCKELIVDSMSNKDELKDLMDHYDEDLSSLINRLKGSSKFVEEVKKLESKGLLQPINSNVEEELKRQIIAGRYLMSVSKGETAQEIAYVLDSIETDKIQVPQYIKEAIEWVLKN